MKKVKVMLLSALVFAVVGGALAFKAQKGTRFMYTTQNGVCELFTTTALTSIDPNPVSPSVGSFYITKEANECKTLTTAWTDPE